MNNLKHRESASWFWQHSAQTVRTARLELLLCHHYSAPVVEWMEPFRPEALKMMDSILFPVPHYSHSSLSNSEQQPKKAVLHQVEFQLILWVRTWGGLSLSFLLRGNPCCLCKGQSFCLSFFFMSWRLSKVFYAEGWFESRLWHSADCYSGRGWESLVRTWDTWELWKPYQGGYP